MPQSHASRFTFSDQDLEQFRQVQALAYECAETIAGQLEVGMSERDAAKMMETWLLEQGVDDWFHRPFAWFGDRTAFAGPVSWKFLKGFNPAFYPSKRKLERNMPFILDCAPSVRGYTADIGYCNVIGENAELDAQMDALLEFRQMILEQVRERRSLAEISRAVDALCDKHGFAPRHKAYPFETLAHRVEILPPDNKKSHLNLFHFGARNIMELGKDKLLGMREGWSPIWSSGKASEHPPTPGLWAVEPHLGRNGVGAKFEELLVVTEDDAFWLDDDIPHVRRWKQRDLLQGAA